MSDAAVAELEPKIGATQRLRCRRRRPSQLLPPTPAKPVTAAAGANPAHRPTAASRVVRGLSGPAILAELHSERFVDTSPTEVWATLLDEGRYLGSISTFYRLLRQAGESRERRRASHPPSDR